MLVLCMLLCFAPLTAEAKTQYHTTVHTLKQKTWTTVKGVQISENKYDYHVYKISVPKGGYVRIYLNDANAVKQKKRPCLYKTISQNESLMELNDLISFSNSGADTFYVSLEEGDYYFYAVKGTKVKWDFQKMAHPSNYCKAKAAVQESGKNKTLYFDYGYEYPQWFKVTLTKSQKISAFIRNLDIAYEPNMMILDSKCRKVSTSKTDGYGCYTLRSGVLPKGTYYIRVARSDNYFEDHSDTLDDGRIYSFTWRKY